jgi:hypothetical protein
MLIFLAFKKRININGNISRILESHGWIIKPLVGCNAQGKIVNLSLLRQNPMGTISLGLYSLLNL